MRVSKPRPARGARQTRAAEGSNGPLIWQRMDGGFDLLPTCLRSSDSPMATLTPAAVHATLPGVTSL